MNTKKERKEFCSYFAPSYLRVTSFRLHSVFTSHGWFFFAVKYKKRKPSRFVLCLLLNHRMEIQFNIRFSYITLAILHARLMSQSNG